MKLNTRILATAFCLGLLTSIVSATMMWWKRRPAGTAGLAIGDPGGGKTQRQEVSSHRI